jgi:hypothetical protein
MVASVFEAEASERMDGRPRDGRECVSERGRQPGGQGDVAADY